KFNGTSLAAVQAEDEDESGPGRKLVELARKLEPDDTVQVEFRRGNDTKQTTLVAADLGSSFRMEMPGPAMIMPRVREMEEPLELSRMLLGTPWGDLELVSLNSDLGEYFGTKDGVLVVKAPADSTLPLKGGDVITSIGGRKPANPSHAMRILRSYEKGETVSIEILRTQKRLTVAWKVPEREDRFMRMHQERAEQLLARRVRHPHIDDDRIERVFAHPGERLAAAGGRLHLVTPAREIALQRHADRGLVVHHEHVQPVGDEMRGRGARELAGG